MWSLGIILVNLTCGRNPWKRAWLEDSTYRAYTRDPSFLRSILPISRELDTILGRIFERNPHNRTGLSELRQMILECPSFTSPMVDTGLLTPHPEPQDASQPSLGPASEINVSHPVSANSSTSSESSLSDSASDRSSNSSWSSVSSHGSYQKPQLISTALHTLPETPPQRGLIVPPSVGIFPGSQFITNCCSYLCGPLIQPQHTFVPQVPLVC